MSLRAGGMPPISPGGFRCRRLNTAVGFVDAQVPGGPWGGRVPGPTRGQLADRRHSPVQPDADQVSLGAFVAFVGLRLISALLQRDQ